MTPEFNPVKLFQRVDRAGKGYLTKTDFAQLIKDNGFAYEYQIWLPKKKMTYQTFLSFILDKNHQAQYFNMRLKANDDEVVRKIDRLSEQLELGLCELIFLQTKLKEDAEFFRNQLKNCPDYNIITLYKALAFSDTRSCTKTVLPQDLSRFFVMNNLLLEPDRLEYFYERLVPQGQQFDLAHLTRLVTSNKRQPIIENTTVKVSGKNEDHRRTTPLVDHNPNLRNSLTPQASRCTQKLGGVRSKSLTKTKAYQTDYINTECLMAALRQFLRDQLKIDDELEDCKIKLVASRDFYPKQAYEMVNTFNKL